jgi:thiaminase (transcriptional activator TenA)
MAALPADLIYADWIATFGNADYGDLVHETTGLLDRLGAAATRPGVDHLAAIFERSTRYELQFWDMAYGVEAPGRVTREKE